MTAASGRTMEMIERLIGIETTSRISNLPLIEFVRNYLVGLGVEPVLTYDDAGRKANLFATLGPKGRGGIIISGHTDTAPVDGQAWSSDPFRLAVRDGKLFGRGIVDIKGFVGIALAQAPTFLERGLATPIHYALSTMRRSAASACRASSTISDGEALCPAHASSASRP